MTMTFKTYNIELKMSDETKLHWLNLLNQSKNAFNFCAKLGMEEKIPCNIKSFHDTMYNRIREKFPLIPSQGAIKIYKEVLSTIRSIKSNKHKNPKTPQRKHLSLHLDKRMYSKLSVDGIYLSTKVPGKREHCTFMLYDKVKELFATYTFADPLIFARKGKLYLSVPFEVPTAPCADETSIGVDVGIKRFFVTSEGKYFKDKAYLTKRRKIRYLKRKLQSKGTKSAKRHLKKLSVKERNISKDMIQRSTSALLRSTKASIIVLEDLKRLKKNTSVTNDGYKRKRHNNALSQVPINAFKEVLMHKAQLVGKRVETVSPVYTSQTDSRTNKRDGKRQGCRYYCSDGVVLDSDWNAAINIANRGNHPHSKPIPLDGSLCFLWGKALSEASTSKERCSLGQAHVL